MKFIIARLDNDKIIVDDHQTYTEDEAKEQMALNIEEYPMDRFVAVIAEF